MPTPIQPHCNPLNSAPDIIAPYPIMPREKLILHGARSLRDDELLAIMLGSGTRKNSVFSIAQQLLPLLELGGLEIDIEQLQTINGIGHSKALMLCAALELARRRIRPEGTLIRQPQDILPLVSHILDRNQEHLLTLSLSGAHEVIKVRTVSIGLLTSCPIHPREIFVGPILDRAYSLIVAHNHPSGDPSPSREDEQVTQRIAAAGTMLGIRLVDHIIFAKRGYYSFNEHGKIPSS